MAHELYRFLILTHLSLQVIGQLTWERLQTCDGPLSDYPSARRDMVVGFDDIRNQLIVFGGRPGPLNDTWIYTVSSGTWRQVKSNVHPRARHGAVGGVSGDYFYVSTGQGTEDVFFNDIWRLHLQSEFWEQLPSQRILPHISKYNWMELSKLAFQPEERYSAGGGIFPGSSSFFLSQGSSRIHHFDTFTYDTNEMNWIREYGDGSSHPYDPRYPHGRSQHASEVISDFELVIFGGCLTGGGSGGPCPSGDSWLYDRRYRTWKRLDQCATPRLHASMASLPTVPGRRRVVLYGGTENSDQVLHVTEFDKDSVAVLNPDTGTWTQRQCQAADEMISTPGKRSSVGMATGKDGIFLFGGMDEEKNLLYCDVWILRGDAQSADTAPEVSCSAHFISMLTIHGIMMVIGWAVFLQWGAFVARYMKCDNGLWYYCHVGLQISGICFCIVGLVFGILSVEYDHFHFTHAVLGLTTMILVALQPINSLIRPPKLPEFCESKSRSRRIWECIHFFGGRSSLILAYINISLGVFLAVTNTVFWALWFAYLAFIVAVHLLTEAVRSLRGRKRDNQEPELIHYPPTERTKYVVAEQPKEQPTDYGQRDTTAI